MFKKYKKKIVLLLIIIIVALFLRGYMAVERFDFAHDADLYSWIVKDIVVDKNVRLIGQETSTPGIFIGPFFYYLLIPFYLLTTMDPIGVIFFSLLLSVLTLLSYFFIFNRLFNSQSGLIAVSLQAVLMSRINFDRWIVPTVTTSLWEIWYFYSIVMVSRGDFSVLPLLGILCGLIWHINLSLAPLLILIPIAIFLSKKLPTPRSCLKMLIGMAVPLIPLILFEVRNNFSQSQALLGSFLINQGGGTGWDKFLKVVGYVSHNISDLFLYPTRIDFLPEVWVPLLIILIGIYITKKGYAKKQELILILLWVITEIIFFSISSKSVSGYYFSNVNTVMLALVIIITTVFYKAQKTKTFFIILIILLASRSIFYIVTINPYNNAGYAERKEVARYITEDAKKRDFPCVSISFITNPGENVGFRYFFYLNKLHVNQPISGSPVYTIVIPPSLAEGAVEKTFGAVGVITPPQSKIDRAKLEYSCSGQNSNLTDPFLGFVK